MALEAAKRLAPAFALGLLSSQERARGGVHLTLGDRDPMEGQVQLAVALAVQAMAALLARGGIEGGDAGEP